MSTEGRAFEEGLQEEEMSKPRAVGQAWGGELWKEASVCRATACAVEDPSESGVSNAWHWTEGVSR